MEAENHGPKIRETIVRVNSREYPRVVVDFGTGTDGKRKRRTFKTRAQAERAVATWQAEQKVLNRQIGKTAERFLSGDVQDAATALNILGPGIKLADAARMHRTLTDADLSIDGVLATCRAVNNAKLDATDLHDAGEAVKELKKRATLLDAARFYMERHFPEGGDRTVDELVEEYIESRKQVDRRPATIRDIRGTLGRAYPANVERPSAGTLRLKPSGFAFDFKDVPVSHVTTTDLERWMDRHRGKAKATWRGYRVHLVGLFNFAILRKYCRENPAAALMTPKTSKSAKTRPYVMPVEDVEAVLRYAAANEPDSVPYFALALFAGIRPQGELSRMTWGDIDFGRREIDIRADTSKTGDERFIEMSDNLVAWLLPHRRPGGPVATTRNTIERVRRGAGVRWAPDCMRHSFGSYHMAMYENAGKTALQMGHRTIDTTFEHYRRAVRKEDAAAFWAIRPAKAESNEVAFNVKAG